MTSAVKVLVPGEHAMVSLLGTRDELLRTHRGRLPRDDPRARQRDRDPAEDAAETDASPGCSRSWCCCSTAASDRPRGWCARPSA
jgi:hypothetical protein